MSLGADRQAPPIALVPIGQVDEAILTVIGEGLQEAFGRDCVLAASLPHPDYAYERQRGQYLADAILARLRHLSLPAERWLGIVDVDLYTPGLNFVFGQAVRAMPEYKTLGEAETALEQYLELGAPLGQEKEGEK